MKAWQIHELGEPKESLKVEEMDTPEPMAGQLLIEVDAVGLAFPDVLQCRGEYQVKPPLPFTPGGETAGRVIAVGEGVEDFRVGQKVISLGGGLSEQALVQAQMSFGVPDSMDQVKAAALPMNYGTTWFALHDRALIKSGESLLVTGASGGTGSAAIQLGLAAGARVIAVAGGKEKVDACRELGADVVIDHKEEEDLVEKVREVTNNSGVDVAYDPVGGEVFQKVRRCMAWNGRLLVIGFVAGIPEIATNHVLLKNYSVVGVHWGASLGRDPGSFKQQMSSVVELSKSGEVDPLLHPTYEFDSANQALQDIADRKVVGKVVVDLNKT
ncbi:MAG: NADPH:quinone oxidoreductase family protein [Acidimicrobiales bacterium]|nr:NADPH:quinone oxidoreductase family protein [Acidimicrobiales bacterium]|tara:strand:- start:5461 stop:6441 length:981 start_codon:yes stop_codon:yes gene_type:complete